MKTRLPIHNLKCNGCANKISKKLNLLKNISNVEVNNENHTVTILHQNEADLVLIKATFSQLGYPEDGKANSWGEKAKSYLSCVIGRMS